MINYVDENMNKILMPGKNRRHYEKEKTVSIVLFYR